MGRHKKVPKRRFEGFTGEWEERKLGEVVGITMGQSPSGKNYTDNPNDYILVQGNADIINGWVTPRIWTTQITKTAKKGDIILSVRAPVGDIGKTKYDVVLGRGVAGIRGNEFIFHYLSKMKNNRYWRRYSTGSTFESISSNDLNEATIRIPCEDEQQKIGNFFKKLDEVISLQQRKLEKTKALKSAYLAEMFPDEGERVPKRRFAGFTEEWEVRKLGDFGSVAMNKRIFKEQTSEEGDVPFYKIGTFGGKPDAYISYELFEEYKAKYPYPEIGDILISASGSIGRTVEYTGEDEYFQDSNIVWLKHDGRLNNLFLKQYYAIVKWEGLEGSTIKRLYNKNILETQIKVPSLSEQQKIGEFFKQLDDKISIEQRKLDKLKALKQAYLHEMFV